MVSVINSFIIRRVHILLGKFNMNRIGGDRSKLICVGQLGIQPFIYERPHPSWKKEIKTIFRSGNDTFPKGGIE
jgi:hypothetical protein